MSVQTHLFPEPPNAPRETPPGASAQTGDGSNQTGDGSNQTGDGSNQTGDGSAQPRAAAAQSSRLAPVWLQRLSLFILVLFCVYLGVFVAVLPWVSSLWNHNLFFTSHPRLWSVLRLASVRGVISGLGLLDIWIGISEAIHYRDQRS